MIMDKMDGNGLNISELNAEIIKKHFPECVTDGKIDFDVLRQLIGDQIESEDERYHFEWIGKKDAKSSALSPTRATLVPLPEKSRNWEQSNNIYIEGDNLEALKALSKTYHNKIKTIYIDPPYNTGGDFIYKDDYSSTKDDYLDNSNQNLRSNAATSGRFHTNWLNMIYPRLVLAKELLSEDGAIFISIDDNEIKNLRNVCDEIFGESNHIGTFIWKKRAGGGFGSATISVNTEYIVCYAKDEESIRIHNLEKEIDDIESNYLLKDKKGNYKRRDLRKSGVGDRREDRPTMFFPVKAPDGSTIYPKRADGSDGRWMCAQNTYLELLEKDEIDFVKVDGTWKVYTKERPYDESGNIKTEKHTSLLEKMPLNTTGSKEIELLFGDKNVFSFPKPTDLIKYFVNMCADDGSIVLDFFSGSGTTAEAVMKANAEGNKNIKYILVQIPELIDESQTAYSEGYHNLCDIGEERIRRAGGMILKELKQKKDSAGLFSEEIKTPESLDIGFKVFKLTSTNIIPWDGSKQYDESNLLNLNDVFKEGRTKLDVAYEVMLKYGVFDKQLEEKKINGKDVFCVDNDSLVIFLEDEINMDDVKEIIKLNPTTVVFKESGFADDNVKMNAEYTLRHYLGEDQIKVLCI